VSGTVDPPFTYRITKDGAVRISRQGRVVTVVAGARARSLADRLRGAEPREAQQVLARATGDYRRGNECSAKRGGHPA
jgi:hypothetical protein